MPQGSSGRTVTRSPGCQPVTPLPIAVMVPDISCPMTCGRCQAVRHGAVKQVQIGAADAAVGNPDLHLARSGRDGRAGTHADSLIAFEKCGSHERV